MEPEPESIPRRMGMWVAVIGLLGVVIGSVGSSLGNWLIVRTEYQQRREIEQYDRMSEAYFTFSAAHSTAVRLLRSLEECSERYASEASPLLTACDAERRDWEDAMVALDNARVGVGVYDSTGDAAWHATNAVQELEQRMEGKMLPIDTTPAIDNFHWWMCVDLGWSDKECAP